MLLQRGSDQTLVFAIAGDYILQDLLFTVTETQRSASIRIIDMIITNKSYSNNETFCTITLDKADTMQIDNDFLYYDIRVSDTKEILQSGRLEVQKGSRTDYNGTIIEEDKIIYSIVDLDNFNEFDILQVQLVEGQKTLVGISQDVFLPNYLPNELKYSGVA